MPIRLGTAERRARRAIPLSIGTSEFPLAPSAAQFALVVDSSLLFPAKWQIPISNGTNIPGREFIMASL